MTNLLNYDTDIMHNSALNSTAFNESCAKVVVTHYLFRVIKDCQDYRQKEYKETFCLYVSILKFFDDV